MGTAGNLKNADDRAIFQMYVAETMKRLQPRNIVVYGDTLENIFRAAPDAGVNVVPFPTQTQLVHARKNRCS